MLLYLSYLLLYRSKIANIYKDKNRGIREELSNSNKESNKELIGVVKYNNKIL